VSERTGICAGEATRSRTVGHSVIQVSSSDEGPKLRLNQQSGEGGADRWSETVRDDLLTQIAASQTGHAVLAVTFARAESFTDVSRPAQGVL
jgi:hypothetical protein